MPSVKLVHYCKEGLSYRWLPNEFLNRNNEILKIGGVPEDKCDMENGDIVLRVYGSSDECAFGRT